jgi:hypothetical protein
VVESVEESLERAIHGASAVAGVEWGGAAVRGRRGCWGRSWKVHKGAPARGGARGGDGRAGWWPLEAALGGPGCGGRKGGAHRLGTPLIAAQGGGRGWQNWWAVNTVGSEVMGRGKRRRPLSEGDRRCLNAVQTRLARGWDRETDTWGPHSFFIIPELSKLAQL